MIQTLAFNARLPVLLGASPFYLTPDAPIARGITFTEEDYLRARLTALGVQAPQFERNDIYTLFIATRIINFLKGFSLPCCRDLMEMLNDCGSEPRARIGIELIRRLADTARLYFWTRRGLIENHKFKTDIFQRVLLQAGVITCRDGREITVGAFARTLGSRMPCHRSAPQQTSATMAGAIDASLLEPRHDALGKEANVFQR